MIQNRKKNIMGTKSTTMVTVWSHRSIFSLPPLGEKPDFLQNGWWLHCYKILVIMLVLLLFFRFELKFLCHSNCLYEGPYWVLSYYKFSSHYVDFFGKNSWGYIVTFMCNGPQISQFQYKGWRFRICISSQRENNNLECVW